MKNQKLLLSASVAMLALVAAAGAQADPQAPAAPAPPPPAPMPWPGMSSGLAANPYPPALDAGPLGKVTVDGVISGLGLGQTHPAVDFFGAQNHSGYGDVSNAQLIFNKSDGPIQFFLQVGTYSLPDLGTPYYKAQTAAPNTFGFVPQGFLKFAPNANVSIEAGALPTLQGAEYTFTFENYNVERGLLWNQENAVNKGVQVNYTKGPWAASFAFTDGYDSDIYNSLSGLLTYTFKNSDTLTFVGQGEFGTVNVNTLVTPVAQANSTLFDLIYSHTAGKWTISPYIQYTLVPANRATAAAAPLGGSGSGSTIGGALFVRYAFTPRFSVDARGEYISSDGSANLLYGPRSTAWSLTLTPTYQWSVFFVRGEASYVSAGSGTAGFMFGPAGRNSDQTRILAEAGLLF